MTDAPKINVYLLFPGKAKQALALYEEVFATKAAFVQYYKDAPPQAGISVADADRERIIHAHLQIGGDMLMLSDVLSADDASITSSGMAQLSLHPTSKADADRLFAALSQGGSIEMPLADQFWGDYFGACRDQFGVGWMVNFEPPKDAP